MLPSSLKINSCSSQIPKTTGGPNKRPHLRSMLVSVSSKLNFNDIVCFNVNDHVLKGATINGYSMLSIPNREHILRFKGDHMIDSVIYWLINHCTGLARTGVTSLCRQFGVLEVIYRIYFCNVGNRFYN